MSLLLKFAISILLVFLSNTIEIESVEQIYSLETRYIEVPVDHFSALPSPKYFKLRYLINSKYHVRGGPVFVYTGNDGDISIFAQNTGFMYDIAPVFNALLVFIEHRYYGQSLPFGNSTFSSPDNMQYLTSTQALADFAFVIEHLKKSFFENVISYDTHPFVAFGGSYGGMLAAWLRMKYPYSVIGAISSSAPMFYFPGMTSCELFYDKVTQVFEKYGHDQCVKTIKLGWDVIINLSKTKLGMDFISTTWKLCGKLKNSEDTEMLLNWLGNIYVNIALTNYHYPTDFYTPLPAYPVKVFCDKLTTSYFNDTKGLIEHFSHALEIYTNYTGKRVCNNINSSIDDYTEFAWDYQQCTELVMPKCSTDADMFITKPWDFEKYSMNCFKKFGVKTFEPDWAVIAYGGKNLRHYSNIVFSNGMMDPYSCGGVTGNMSASIWAFNISDAPHHIDLRNSDVADNNYVFSARAFHIQAIKQWLNMV
ncbi:unnamed protein product [Psylliodes chrysocephalus]|uniref:Lysosomal Pro-X carboxypeptidase n=1 Tax=Psylliodes chrysocephalus TaxID=3402493 RepID=A0A9P0GB87_9CUCU|nr:unnamed protein product [Psylliodes chrysocephala]